MRKRSNDRTAFLLALPTRERRELQEKIGERERYALQPLALWARDGQPAP